ncbi:MAG: chromate transporter [Coriobacteriaceae bacterium]|nr:chromate transporter [Coriobacteriaceae bacterium]
MMLLTLVLIFLQHCKIGLFSVGGGYATVPFFEDLGSSMGWYDTGQLADMMAIAQSLPGAFGVNLASYVGYVLEGPLGSLIAVIGLITPCTIIIILIAKLLDRFRTSKRYQDLMYGLRPAAVALLVAAGLTVCRLVLVDDESWAALWSGGGFVITDLINFGPLVLLVIVIVLSNIGRLKNIHPIVWIAVCAAVGVIFSF